MSRHAISLAGVLMLMIGASSSNAEEILDAEKIEVLQNLNVSNDLRSRINQQVVDLSVYYQRQDPKEPKIIDWGDASSSAGGDSGSGYIPDEAMNVMTSADFGR